MNDNFIFTECKEFLKKLKEHGMSFIFIQPIEEVINSIPEYSQLIKHPTDLLKIEKKLNDNQFSNLEEMRDNIDEMILNCKTFNNIKTHWVYQTCEKFEKHYLSQYKNLSQKILKHIEKQNTLLLTKTHRKEESMNYPSGNIMSDTNQNIQIISNTEDEKIYKRIKTVFLKLGENLHVSEEQREEIIALIVKNIVKRTKTIDQIYDDTMKFLSKNLKNDGTNKTYFSRKFRKLLRAIKEEQNESAIKTEAKIFNIKINLNENEEKREEKEKMEIIKKEVKNFIESQKIPETLRDLNEYPMDPNLRKKVYGYVAEIRNNFTLKYN